jgi:hypothetical protein
LTPPPFLSVAEHPLFNNGECHTRSGFLSKRAASQSINP